MSSSQLTETDPYLQIYEAQAIIVEKNQALQEKDFEIERLRQENERLRMGNNSNRNQQYQLEQKEKLENELVNRLESLELRWKELMKALPITADRTNQRLDALEVNLNKTAASTAERSQLKDQLAAVNKKVTRLEEELAESRKNNFDLIDRFSTMELQLKKQITAIQLSINPTNQRLEAPRMAENPLVPTPAKRNISDLIDGWEPFDELSAKQPVKNQQKFMDFAQNIKSTPVNILEEQHKLQQMNTSVLILGGKGGLSKIYLFDSKAQNWKQLRITLPVGMEGFGAVVVNEELYIFGGFLNHIWQENCYKLNKSGGGWFHLKPLNQKRDNIANNCLVYKGDIWVIGGYCEKALKSVEKYDISQDKWTYMPTLNYERHSSASAIYKDRIFVTGGKNKAELTSVEMFDPKLQKWILFCDLPFSLHGHTMLINNSIISIFGGKSNTLGRLNVEWEMDIEDPMRELKEIRNFKYARVHFGIAKLSNETILFGDLGGADDKSEIFDGNNWIDGPKLPLKCTYSAYSVIPRSLEERFLMKFS